MSSRPAACARTRWPSRNVRRCRRGTRSPSVEAGDDLDAARAADADLDLAVAHAIAVDDEHRVPCTASAGTSSASGFFARHDVGLDAHAEMQRRVVRQRDANTVGLGDGIAHGRDLAAPCPPARLRKGIGAQQHGLVDRDARNVLLVDLGDDVQRLRRADAEQDLPGSTISPTSPSRRSTTPSIGEAMRK